MNLHQTIYGQSRGTQAVTVCLFAALALAGYWVSPWLMVVPVAMAILFAMTALSTSVGPAAWFNVYIVYLMFEGGIKIWTNYNAIFRVGSDLLLIAVFVKLLLRHNESSQAIASDRGVDASMRFLPFLLIFWLWVAVQFVNPWGIGFLPSLAALKLYVVPSLVFFIVAFLLKREELKPIPLLLLALGVVQGVVATIDGIQGDSFLPSMHPRYISAMAGKFTGLQYRPFGTTHLPGGPATWMLHCGCAAGFVMISMRHASRAFQFAKKWSLLIFAFFPVAISTLLLCQVRTAMLRFAVIITAGMLIAHPRRFMTGVITLALAILLLSQSLRHTSFGSIIDPERIELIASRFLALGQSRTWQTARQGSLEGMARLASFTTMGIGLSRVGAASAPWKERMSRETIFSDQFSFADNAYRALFTELGWGGLGTYLMMMGALLFVILSRRTRVGVLVGVYIAIIIASGYASEGILYQPNIGFFWLFGALALRWPEGEGRPSYHASYHASYHVGTEVDSAGKGVSIVSRDSAPQKPTHSSYLPPSPSDRSSGNGC